MLIRKLASPLLEASVVAFTAGTFIYLGATEVLNEEFEDIAASERWTRFSLLLAGVCTIGAVDLMGGLLGSGHH